MADPTGREAFEKWHLEKFGRVPAWSEPFATYLGPASPFWEAFQAGRDSMKTEAAQAIEAEADRLEKLDKGPAVLVRKFAARFRDSK